MGRLTKAHGLKGAIKIELYTDDPDRRFVPGAVFFLQVPENSPWHGKTLELIELKWYNTHAVGFFKDVADRTAAESLAKGILLVDHDMAEASTEEDAWYDHQLIGLAVMRDGVKVGTVSRLDHLPAQDLLHVATESGDVMVPFVKAIVPTVDIAAGIITVTPPVGLFEPVPESEDLPEGLPETDTAPSTDAVPSATATSSTTVTSSTDASETSDQAGTGADAT